MSNTAILAYVITCALFFSAESASFLLRKRRKPLDKYMCYFLISIILFGLAAAFRIDRAKEPLSIMVFTMVLGMVATFFFLVYVLFRGMIVVFSISAEGDEHSTCRAIRKLTKKPLMAYGLIIALVILSNAGPIYSIWSVWSTCHY